MPGPENPTGPRPFPSLWDQSCGQTTFKRVNKVFVSGPPLGAWCPKCHPFKISKSRLRCSESLILGRRIFSPFSNFPGRIAGGGTEYARLPLTRGHWVCQSFVPQAGLWLRAEPSTWPFIHVRVLKIWLLLGGSAPQAPPFGRPLSRPPQARFER